MWVLPVFIYDSGGRGRRAVLLLTLLLCCGLRLGEPRNTDRLAVGGWRQLSYPIIGGEYLLSGSPCEPGAAISRSRSCGV